MWYYTDSRLFRYTNEFKILFKTKTIWELQIKQVKKSVNVSLDIKIYVDINILTEAETMKEHFPKILYLIKTKQQNRK